MKWSSSLVLALILCLYCTGSSEGYSSYPYPLWSPYAFGLVCSGAEYSPYAFGIGSNGLVPDGLSYNPYAFGTSSNGLVSSNLIYNSYAFGVGRNGLISDCTAFYQPYCGCRRGYQSCGDSLQRYQPVAAVSIYPRNDRAKIRQQEQRSKNFTPGGQGVISSYLKSKGINFRTDRILRIEDRLISVNYLLQDCNVMIKYWNPAEILALENQSNSAKTCYQNYLQSWQQYVSEFRAAGGHVLQIIACDDEEIMANLREIEEPGSE